MGEEREGVGGGIALGREDRSSALISNPRANRAKNGHRSRSGFFSKCVSVSPPSLSPFFLPFDLLPFWKLHLTSHLDWYPRRRDLTRSLCAHVKDDCYQPSSPGASERPSPPYVDLLTTFHFHLILQLNLVLSSSSVRSSLDGVSAAECAPETLLPPPPHVFPPLLTSSERKELEGEREKKFVITFHLSLIPLPLLLPSSPRHTNYCNGRGREGKKGIFLVPLFFRV